ncbi:MAG: endonuclease III domain-containing protein [Nanoarchaeota archaeon]|nr:endonuclease III domain-containing protein [Nanoarchaeota archaeon]MBU1031230.1 endonuclease III domain-containing protein [Nanoarchaeota archaeon]MBU1849531.1 endonuclease III domain-containing protein [Nanoarchaeota archaeon]
MKNRILQTYKNLYAEYSPQGWWPLLSCKGVNPTKTGSINGYHPNNYSYPHNDDERLEICIGAILTQNTSWPNVEKALLNLQKLKAINQKKILKLKIEKLKEAIRPAGYFNQKAKKLKIFAEFYNELKGRTPLRDELLTIWGVGPETADSILLYAYNEPFFVIDAYTKRIFTRLGLTGINSSYAELQNLFHKNLKRDTKIFNEYHALIVEHAKNKCQNKPFCKSCCLKKICAFDCV